MDQLLDNLENVTRSSRSGQQRCATMQFLAGLKSGMTIAPNQIFAHDNPSNRVPSKRHCPTHVQEPQRITQLRLAPTRRLVRSNPPPFDHSRAMHLYFGRKLQPTVPVGLWFHVTTWLRLAPGTRSRTATQVEWRNPTLRRPARLAGSCHARSQSSNIHASAIARLL